MDHQGESGLAEQCRNPGANLRAYQLDGLLPPAIRRHQEIAQVPAVRSLGVEMTMAKAGWVEMGSRRFEARSVALPDGMEMHAVLSRRESGDSHVHQDPIPLFPKDHPAHIGALAVPQGALDRCRRRGRRAAAAPEDSQRRSD